MITSETVFNVVAQGSYTKSRVVLASYDNRKIAEHMVKNYWVHHWPTFSISVEEEQG